MTKKNIYRWHRTLSLIIAIPLVLSAGSGFMHPIMTNIRPSVITQGLRPIPLDSTQLLISLQAALDSNHLDSISKFRIVHIDTNCFYQVQRWAKGEPVYLSARNGRKLPNGDWLYAQYLARSFLEGQPKTPSGPKSLGESIILTSMTMDLPSTEPDCCGAATTSILNAKGSRVVGAVRITQYDEEYAEVNRLLPVYRVSFSRPDGIRIYVETTQDRFALAVDNRRAAFNSVFQYIHTYKWLDFLGQGKQVAMFLLMATAFLTTVMGVYIFFSTSSKKVSGNGNVTSRRNHRYTAIVISLFTAMFTFSGGYHAIYKLKEDTRNNYFAKDRFAARDIVLDYAKLHSTLRLPITSISLVKLGSAAYWQVTVTRSSNPARKDLMRDMSVAAPAVSYINAVDNTVLPDGEARYADWLATQFSGHSPADITAIALVTKFDADYNFTDKRLPVWKVSYPQNGHERFYVETSTGSLSVRKNDWDLVEGYSFALLHKHEFLGGIGKWAKDTSTMFWAAAQLFMVALGLWLYFRWVRQKNAGAPPATGE